MKQGCVYFFKHKNWSPIKIGYSSNESPINRFTQFKTYAPFGCQIVGFIKTYEAKELETKLHNQFEAFRLEGEWFSISEDVVYDLIDLHSSDEQKEELYNIQKIYAEKVKTRLNYREKTNILCELFDNILSGTKEYTSEILSQYNLDDDSEEISSKMLFKELNKYCKSRNFNLTKGRDSIGRYFVINN